MRSSAPTRKVALRSTKIFAQKAMDFGALRGEYQPYEGGAVDLNQILEERDACGVGVIASLKGERTHKCVDDSLSALGCMEHRGACSADNDSGDGAGIMFADPVADVIQMVCCERYFWLFRRIFRCFHDLLADR